MSDACISRYENRRQTSTLDLCMDNVRVSVSSQERLQQACTTRDNEALDSLCVACLNDGLAQCECWLVV